MLYAFWPGIKDFIFIEGASWGRGIWRCNKTWFPFNMFNHLRTVLGFRRVLIIDTWVYLLCVSFWKWSKVKCVPDSGFTLVQRWIMVDQLALGTQHWPNVRPTSKKTWRTMFISNENLLFRSTKKSTDCVDEKIAYK